MVAVVTMPFQTDWTVDDLDRLPDDGLQYELLDGLLLVTPAPIPDHQRMSRGIFRLLDVACVPLYEVFFAPLDWRPDRRTSLQPDVLVVARADVGPKNIQLPLALAVEVLSPSTRRKDLLLKHSKYEESGIGAYWVLDPKGPSITAFELVHGAYEEVGRAAGDEELRLEQPYPVSVVPVRLLD
jgi:Uma2 family endonuclease